MNYIILAAGKGSRLHPLTFTMPKHLFKLTETTSILKRMVTLIRKYDPKSNIIVVTGYLEDLIYKEISDVHFVSNPFYAVTNSIASLWFAREHLVGDVVIINGDIVVEESLLKDVLTKPVATPCVLLDSSTKKDGDYNVQVQKDRVVVMSKELTEYYGEYAGVTLLNKDSSAALLQEINSMVKEEAYDQWYENALVRMIFTQNFHVGFIDIANYKWTEVDNVNDLLAAKAIV